MLAEWLPQFAGQLPRATAKHRQVVRDGKRVQRRGDPRSYEFLLPHGIVLTCTRAQFRRIHPEVNSGTLCVMVRGKVRRSNCIVFVGLVDGETADIDG